MQTKYDAIIVLAGGVNKDETLPPIPKARVNLGIKFLNQGLAPLIVFSGSFSFMFQNPLSLNESRAMKKYAISSGVPENKILQEDRSKDTVGNAYFTKIDFAKPRRWTRLIVVTSDYHLRRTEYLFAKVFGGSYRIDFRPAKTDLTADEVRNTKEFERQQLAFAHQWLDPIAAGDDAKIGLLLFTKHPGYAPSPEMTTEELTKKVKSL